MKAYVLTISIVFLTSFVHGQEETMTKDRIGLGKAVMSASEREGFKLSEMANRNLNISLEEVNGENVIVPKSSLVSYLDFLAVYRLRNGWYRSIEVEPSYKDGNASFSSKEFKAGDKVVVENGGLLRVVELDIFGPEADACADGN